MSVNKNCSYVYIYIVLLTAFILCCTNVYGQTEFTFMSYNCENLFDTKHDDGKDDFAFLPEQMRRWNNKKLYQKLRNICKVILATDSVRPVDIVCLLEVENDSVMTFLTERTPLNRIGYDYVMTHSEDARGIDVAFLYSPLTFRLIEQRCIRIPSNRTRDILYISGVVSNGDTLDVYGVHFPSNLSGAESLALRNDVAEILRDDIDSVMGYRLNPGIIVAGDFNDVAKSSLFRDKLSTVSAKDGISETKGEKVLLYNLMDGREGGTYKYQGFWRIIDHILVSSRLMDRKSSISCSYADAKIVTNSFLLEKDDIYGGMRPFRTYHGMKYQNGFSDHLPVFVRFRMNEKAF